MKWIGWLLKLCATIVAVSLLTVATTGYVVNSYIESLLGSYNIPVAGHAPSLGGIMKDMLGFGGSGKASEGEALTADTEVTGKANGSDVEDGAGEAAGSVGDGSGSTGGGSPSQSLGGNSADSTVGSGAGNGQNGAAGASGTAGTGSGSGAADGTDGTDGTGTDDAAPEDSLPVMGGMSSNEAGQGALEQDQQVVVTPDDLAAKKDELPDKQKEEIFAILMSKLPQEDMQILTVALEGGLTETEMINIEQILSKHLDKTEYAKVMEMLKE